MTGHSPDISETYFWIGHPCVSESKFHTDAPAFWSCATKMVLPLLSLAKNSEGHGIRPRSLQVTAKSALTAEVVKGTGPPPHKSQFNGTIARPWLRTWRESILGMLQGDNFTSRIYRRLLPPDAKSPKEIENRPLIFPEDGGL